MADVALRAGVSSQTVSRVSNGASNVNDDTRARVITAMKELGYRPNGAARALRRGKFHSIGVIAFTLETYGNVRTVEAVTAAAAAHGYSITLIQASDRTLGSVSGAYNQLADEAVDAVVLILEARLLDHAQAQFPPDLPIVVIDSDETTDYSTVDTNQVQGARIATEHLLDLGHRNVWHISGPLQSYAATRRAEAWRDVLRERGIAAPEVLEGDWTAESGYRLGKALAQRDEVTAIFASNDEMALGVLRVLHEIGRKVPEDVSVVGFDDSPQAAFFWPPLTSVRQDFERVGTYAVETVLSALDHPGQKVHTHLVPTNLVTRVSTGATRSNGSITSRRP